MKGMPYRTVHEVLAAYSRQEITEKQKAHYINQIKAREARQAQSEINYRGKGAQNIGWRRKSI